MARTFVQIRQQIEKLEKEAESIKAKEVAGVIDRIQQAIHFYGLTADDLFGSTPKKPGRPKGAPGVVAKKAAKKMAARANFKDANSNRTWTGHGKRPRWFVDAIAAGKTPEDMAIVG